MWRHHFPALGGPPTTQSIKVVIVVAYYYLCVNVYGRLYVQSKAMLFWAENKIFWEFFQVQGAEIEMSPPLKAISYKSDLANP